MPRFSVLSLRFGRAVIDSLSEADTNFYKRAGDIFFGEHSKLEWEGRPFSIPVSFEMATETRLAYEQIARYLRPIRSNVQNIIVDLSQPANHALLTHHVAGGLLRAIREDRHQHRERTYVFVLPSMLPEDDAIRIAFQPLVAERAITLVATNGDALGASAYAMNTQEIARLAAARRPDALIALRQKLIRVPGHFATKRNGRIVGCASHFCDGRLCQREIGELLERHFADRNWSVAGTKLLYHSTISRWCEDAVEAFSVKHAIASRNLADLDRASILNEFTEGSGRIVLVLPLLDTGATLTELLAEVPETILSRVHILSVLATIGEKEERGEVAIGVPARRFNVAYLLRVKQHRVQRFDCPLCGAGIPHTDPLRPDPSYEMTSIAFWTLAEDLGFQQEDNVPQYRLGESAVPALRNIGVDNGAFVASRIDKLLKTLPNTPAEPVVVCPAEFGSEAVADALEAVFGISVVRIPKTDLSLDTQAQEQAWWMQQLRSWLPSPELPAEQRSYPKVILLDELHVTGQTFSRFTSLLAKLGASVLCRIAILDLSVEGKDTAPEPLSLYSITT
jgi:hypothetical protein